MSFSFTLMRYDDNDDDNDTYRALSPFHTPKVQIEFLSSSL